MTLSRRKTLALIGGGTLLAAGGLGTGWAMTRTPTAALVPWERAGTYGDPRLRALSYALLAPNPHNRQPWLAELRGADTVILTRDPARDLPVTDPFARQLTIGMGCFIDLMRMAAAEEGDAVAVDLFPEGEDGPVAVCRWDGTAPSDPLFAHVMDRRSHKEAFEDQAVSAEAAAPLMRYADIYRGGDELQVLRDMAHDAWLTEAATPEAFQESVDLIRIGKAEIEANPDGIDVGGPMMEGLSLMGLLTHAAAADPDNPGSRMVIEGTAAAIEGITAMTVGHTPGNTRRDQIAAGADWLRLNLAATGAGLALRPVSQALQEAEVFAPMYRAVQTFAPDGGTVQMLGLLGYAPRTPRTPRWPLETRLRNA
ncbi:Acg family FMN-binding oxidoreductase [Jannaschia donghaensis]|uniref:NAD(P)H nitroreductase/MT3217 n=1 Tax=Jannaschia donghaensis TaxID=420998 RepID=A0A0M6YJ83_9RHOB|nr:twin-arginine translocation pathway signal protein [Jannaschia donghaensis]CTQ49849.1 hypothetical protein JDO7802_01866 [Jannaschia donghaensis]